MFKGDDLIAVLPKRYRKSLINQQVLNESQCPYLQLTKIVK